MNEESLIYNQGFALINALALAKVVLVGEFFHVGDNLKNRPLIYPIMFKSAVFAVILICFHIIEETLIGVLHGKTLSQSIPDIGGGKLQGILMVGIIMFVVLMPFFAFRELERAIGTEELRSLLFGDETKADAAPPILQRGKQGDKATFTVDSFPNRPFAGEVTQIRQPPQIYEYGATYDVVISAPNPDLLLEPGMTATIRIVSE